MAFLKNRCLASDNRGQGTTEYILLMATVVGFYLLAVSVLGRYKVADTLMSPIQVNFAQAYQYGKVGSTSNPIDPGNFRVFVNPTH